MSDMGALWDSFSLDGSFSWLMRSKCLDAQGVLAQKDVAPAERLKLCQHERKCRQMLASIRDQIRQISKNQRFNDQQLGEKGPRYQKPYRLYLGLALSTCINFNHPRLHRCNYSAISQCNNCQKHCINHAKNFIYINLPFTMKPRPLHQLRT